MAAPEKIYLIQSLLGVLRDSWNAQPSEVFTNIEYTRTDAFIEKACEFIAENMSCNGYTLQTKAKFIKDFKKYMEA